MNPPFVFVALLVAVAMVPSEQADFEAAFEGRWQLLNCVGGFFEGRTLPEDFLSMIVYNDFGASTIDWYEVIGDGATIGYVTGSTSKCDVIKESSTPEGKFLQDYGINLCKEGRERDYKLSDDKKEFTIEFVNEYGKPKCTYKKVLRYYASNV